MNEDSYVRLRRHSTAGCADPVTPSDRITLAVLIEERDELSRRVDELESILSDEEASSVETLELWKKAKKDRDLLLAACESVIGFADRIVSVSPDSTGSISGPARRDLARKFRDLVASKVERVKKNFPDAG